MSDNGNNNTNPGGPPGPAGGPKVIPGPGFDGDPSTPPFSLANPSSTAPASEGPSQPPPSNNSTETSAPAPTTAEPASVAPLETHDDGFSSDDNTHDNSNTSSVHVTPKFKQTRFPSRKMVRAPPSAQAGIENSVLACELALLNALSSDIKGSVEGLDREQWKTRIAQINQVVRMVQWEAQGLF